MPYLSFVMVCYNNWNFTRIAVESFFESLNPLYREKEIEFILVNNGSSDETAAGIEEYKHKYKETAEIITLQLEQNLGYVVGVNTGLSKCRGEIITIMNNDLIFCTGWLDGLVNLLESDKAVGAAVPLLTNGSGRENIMLKFQSPDLEHAFYGSKSTMNYFAQKIMEKNREVVIYSSRVIGACVAVKRKVLDLVGGLDFWFGIGIFDDDDFSLRVNIAGYKTAIVGSSFVYHVGNATFSQVRNVSNAAVLSNKIKFVRKWSLRCVENIEGIYQTREDVILHTAYEREKHFMPVSPEQFKLPLERPAKTEDVRKVLLAADWTNFKSRWLKKMELIQLKPVPEEISIWSPAAYFSRKDVEDQIQKVMGFNESGFGNSGTVIRYIDKDIPAVDLLRFLSLFDTVLTVEDDFVNRYITLLAEQIGITVQ